MTTPRCPQCNLDRLSTTLPSDQGHYCRCNSCGHLWHAESTEPLVERLKHPPALAFQARTRELSPN